MWRIGVWSMVLSMCGMFVFVIDNEDIGSRYETLFNLLLAAVAFQYVINDSLPNLPYLTMMDIYVLFTFIFLFLVIILVAVSGYFDIDSLSDRICLYSALFIFTVFHIWFMINAKRARKYEMRKLEMDRWTEENNGYESHNVEPIGVSPGQTRMDEGHKQKLLKRPWWKGHEALKKVSKSSQ